MANWYDVLDCYKEGLEEKERGNYMKAARLFRISYIAFENCELPPYRIQSIADAGDDSHDEFRKIYPLLTDEQRELLRNERRGILSPVTDWFEDFAWGWEKLVRHDYEMIEKDM